MKAAKKLFCIMLTALVIIGTYPVTAGAKESDKNILYQYNAKTAADEWGYFTGNWTYNKNGISVSNDGNDVWYYSYLGADKGWTDYVVEVDLINIAEGGIIFRSADPEAGIDTFGGYVFAYDSAFAFAGMDSNNSWVTVSQAAELAPAAAEMPYAEQMHWKIVVQGNTYYLYINGSDTPCMGVQDGTYTEGGIGIRCKVAEGATSGYFANLVVYELTDNKADTAGADTGKKTDKSSDKDTAAAGTDTSKQDMSKSDTAKTDSTKADSTRTNTDKADTGTSPDKSEEAADTDASLTETEKTASDTSLNSSVESVDDASDTAEDNTAPAENKEAADTGILYQYDPAAAADIWKNYTGSWTYDDNGISVVNDGNDVWYYSYMGIEEGWTDYVIEVDLVNVAEGGVIFRCTDPVQGIDSFGGYIIAYDSAYCFAGKDENDTWITLADDGPLAPAATAMPYTANMHWKIVVQGDIYTLYMDDIDIPVLCVQDSTYSQGGVGVRLKAFEGDSSGYFSNLKVYELADVPASVTEAAAEDVNNKSGDETLGDISVMDAAETSDKTETVADTSDFSWIWIAAFAVVAAGAGTTAYILIKKKKK